MSKIHQPQHIYLDNTDYFISVHTHNNLYIFDDYRKSELLKLLSKLFSKYNYKLYAYAILNNHYHLLFNVTEAKNLPEFYQQLHGSLAFKWNGEDNERGRSIFQSYWDYCIRDKNDFFTHFNYIHQNPIKHRLLKTLDELGNYKYCSYGRWIDKKGEEWMNDIWENYHIINYIVPND